MTAADPWAFGWDALAALGTTSATLVALGVALGPVLAARRSWRRVWFSSRDLETLNGVHYENVSAHNNGSRAIVNVRVLVRDKTDGEPGNFDVWHINHIAAGQSKTLRLDAGCSTDVDDPRAMWFTDWSGREFEISHAPGGGQRVRRVTNRKFLQWIRSKTDTWRERRDNGAEGVHPAVTDDESPTQPSGQA